MISFLKQLVKKTLTAILEGEAKLVLRKYKPRIIAVAGSVGKTSTKDAIFTVIRRPLVARKSPKSFNSEIGVPLTILGCPHAWSNPLLWLNNIIRGMILIITRSHYPKWLVLEVAAGKPGDIKRVAEWLHADVVVMTRFGDVPAHIEFFKSAKELYEEKAEIVKNLKKTGVLVLNADDERVLALRDKTKAKIVTFGLGEGAMFRASNIQILYEEGRPSGTTFKLAYDGNLFPVTMRGVLGIQSVYSALAAIALGAYLKLNIVDSVSALSAHESPPGRMRIIEGMSGSVIIDDTYNSSPVAAEAAVRVLDEIATVSGAPKKKTRIGKKIAVFGDMLELGKFAIEEHQKLGADVGAVADILLAVGPRAKYIAEGALCAGMNEKNILEFENAQTAGKYLESVLGEGDVVLVKGSQAMRMERAVEEVMAHPEKADSLLVRQEEEWKERG